MNGLNELCKIVEKLRGPDGCPWDQAQDHRSMRRFLLEETHEVLEAIDNNNPAALAEELGDLLFVILLLIQIGADAGQFQLETVVRTICDKMIARHPHVFGSDVVDPVQYQRLVAWEEEKQKAHPNRSRIDGIPRSLPALVRAFRQGEKAATVGFDWADHVGVFDKIEEELQELKEAIAGDNHAARVHEYGDLLLAIANLGRHIDATPEESLREATDRFSDRFRHMERVAESQGIRLSDATDEDLNALWEDAKSQTVGPDASRD